MRKLYTLAACLMGVGTACAQSLVIHTKGGATPTVIPLSEIEFMEVNNTISHPEMTELVEFEVVNMGRFSFDVKVKKGDDCVRYVVGAVTSTIYNEDNFVEAAKQTLDENAFYRPYVNAIGTSDQTFAERQLGINSIFNYDEDQRTKVYTTVAVCAFAQDGSHKVYRQEFIVPDAVMGQAPTVAIETSDVTPENFGVSITASADCVKLIYGITSPEALNGTKMSEEVMLKVSQGLPIPYTAPLAYNAGDYEALRPNSTYYVYAIPIAADGSVGKVSYTTVQTPAMTASGTGKVLSASGTLQTEGQYRNVACPQMTFNDAASKVRLMWCSKTDFASFKDRLVEVFCKDNLKNIAWTEYDINSLPRTLNVYHYGDQYYLYAATVDKQGNVSEPQNIIELMGGGQAYTTQPESDIVPDIVFDGKAQATVVNDQTDVDKSAYTGTIYGYMPYFTITPGADLKHLLVIEIDDTVTDIEKGVEGALVGYPAYAIGYGAVHFEFTWNNGTWTLQHDGSEPDNYTNEGNKVRFQEKWVSSMKVVFVSVDTNGRPKILYVYEQAAENGLKEYNN